MHSRLLVDTCISENKDDCQRNECLEGKEKLWLSN